MEKIINIDKIISITCKDKVISQSYVYYKEGDKIWNSFIPTKIKKSGIYRSNSDHPLTREDLEKENLMLVGNHVYHKPSVDIYYSCTNICCDHEISYFDSMEEASLFLDEVVKGSIKFIRIKC